MGIAYDKEKVWKYENLSLNSKWEMQFASLLCNTEERYNEFMDGFYNCNDIRGSLFQYRSYLLSIGRGQDISCDKIENLLQKKEYKSLISLLQELFLEVFQEDILDILISYINRGNSIKKILIRHAYKKELRLGRLIL